MSHLNESFRRHDLDWLRVLVFLLLIFYHVGMFFVPWEWHLKNSSLYSEFQWPMLFINQWRLPVLFVISGMGTAYAMKKRSFKDFAIERSYRLLLPLLFGIIVIVPPQVYFERVIQGAEYEHFLQFLFSDAFVGVYPEGNFSWHHLWFLPYLFIFSMILVPVIVIDEKISKLKNQKPKQNPLLLHLFIIPLFAVEYFLSNRFPVTHALYNDWYTIPFYALLFFYGYFIIKTKTYFWQHTKSNRRIFLVMGIFFFLMLYMLSAIQITGPFRAFLFPLIRVLNLWVWILCIFGYAGRYLNRNNSLLKYCNQAVYPFYILHQTITIGIGFWIYNKPWELTMKFSVLFFGTLLITAFIYEFFIRRIRLLQPLFGLKKNATKLF